MDPFCLPFVQFTLEMDRSVDFAGKVPITLNTVEQSQTRLVDVQMIRIAQCMTLLWVFQIVLNLVRIQLSRSCTSRSRDILGVSG